MGGCVAVQNYIIESVMSEALVTARRRNGRHDFSDERQNRNRHQMRAYSAERHITLPRLEAGAASDQKWRANASSNREPSEKERKGHASKDLGVCKDARSALRVFLCLRDIDTIRLVVPYSRNLAMLAADNPSHFLLCPPAHFPRPI